MKQNKDFFDDVKKVANSTFATMANMKNDISKIVKEQIKSMLKNMDVVTRSEFNAVKKIALDTRKELDEQKKGGNVMKKATKKPAAKKTVAKKPAKKAKKK
jgi:BMFP domain-containing protein YqiC